MFLCIYVVSLYTLYVSGMLRHGERDSLQQKKKKKRKKGWDTYTLSISNIYIFKIIMFQNNCIISAAVIPISIKVQSTLVISKSKGPSKTLRDIHTSTYQICSIEEKKFEQPNVTNDYVI